MFCSKCGAPNSEDAAFCSKCGNPLTTPSKATPSQQSQPASGAQPPARQSNRKNPIIAGFLNLFVGLGYLYLGYRRVFGLPAILFVIVLLLADIFLGLFTFGLVPLILAILLAYDGYVKANGEKGYVTTEPVLLHQ